MKRASRDDLARRDPWPWLRCLAPCAPLARRRQRGPCPGLRTLALYLFLGLCPALAAPPDSLPITHPKYRVARQVFDDLVRAIGDGRTAPSLRLLPADTGSRKRVAWYTPEGNVLTVEERLYDLCVALGPDSLDALAVLVGHELAHYYKDHAWPGDFGNGFADLEVGQTLRESQRDPDRMVEIEVEADYFGGFFGHVAGYNTLGVAPRIFESVYRAYGLRDDLPGYPALAERQEIARRSAESLGDLIPVFDAGCRLLLVARYEAAARCFDHIAATFPSREILNNAGVARALEAVRLFEPGRLPYAYPLELDASTRLRIGGKADEYGPPEPADERRQRLLEEARELFDGARRRDPGYPSALVNLACTADLLGEPEQAMVHATRALKVAQQAGQPSSAAGALVARGIARLHTDPPDTAGARADFEAAAEGNHALARTNLAVLEGGSPPAPAAHLRTGPEETMAGRRATDYNDIVSQARVVQVPRRGEGERPLSIYARGGDAWTGLVVDTGFATVAFLSTTPAYRGTTARDIPLGSPAAAVAERYGEAALLLGSASGTLRFYESSRLLFDLDPAGRVRGWTLIAIDE